MIDLVAVNLYPFEETIAQPDVTRADAIENIDIGGVALIRAAAKNSDRVTLVCDPADYDRVLSLLQEDGVPLEVRRELAVKGFCQTMQYDTAITAYLSGKQAQPLTLYPVQSLRYGENPHQKAVLYGYSAESSPLGGKVLQGKELSYNNLLDLDVVWRRLFPSTRLLLLSSNTSAPAELPARIQSRTHTKLHWPATLFRRLAV